MLSTITIFVAALHVAVTFPAKLPINTRLWALAAFLILGGISFISCFSQTTKKDMSLFRNMLLMKAIGSIVTFSYDFLDEDPASQVRAIQSHIISIILGVLLFTICRSILYIFSFYRSKKAGYIALAAVPFTLLLARLIGPKTHGSYLSVFGILVFSICMILMPFATATAFSDTSTVNRLNPKLTSNSGGELIYITILGIVALMSGKLNHEYGIVMIFVGCLGGLIFFMYGRSTGSKLIFSMTAVLLSFFVTLTSQKVSNRFDVILHLSDQWKHGHLSEEAVPLYYFILRIRGAGFYGYGNAMLSRRLYPTAENDYIFTTLIYNHGLIIGILAFLLGLAMCRYIIATPTSNRYDAVLIQSIGIIFAAIYIISFFGNVGSIPLTGISPVFLAGAGQSMDAAGAMLLGFVSGIESRTLRTA